MYLLVALPFFLMLSLLAAVVYRLAKLNARLRANLAGCTGYPISPSFRRPVSSPLPLSVVEYRAAGRSDRVLELHKSGAMTLHVFSGASA